MENQPSNKVLLQIIMVFDYYLNLLTHFFTTKQEAMYFIIGLVFNLMGISGLIEGIRGISKGRIYLTFNRYSSESQDTRTGFVARIWGTLYFFISLILVGVGSFLIWVFIASYFKH